MIGTILIWIALIAGLSSFFFYFLSIKRGNYISIARGMFIVSISSIYSTALVFLYIILAHRFEFAYVSDYTSRSLSTPLLISTFWAGQEGSFLLWALFISFIGIALLAYISKRHNEAEVMISFNGIFLVFLVLILLQEPFRYVWEKYPDYPFGMIPQDGRGLNPLLQNFWMIIHPPVLFMGFSLLVIPYILATVSLWKKEYLQFVKTLLPWVLLAIAVLGAGLIFGGYWAYGVLGWGGWWGWDPVENSSLIPWLCALILLHICLVLLATQRALKLCLMLSPLPFILSIYSTFLTRSGVLANASVHSFVGSGTVTNTLLVVWLLFLVLIPLVLFVKRFRTIPVSGEAPVPYSRESMLFFTFLLLGFIAMIILLGTSLPMVSESTVEPAFYNQTLFPFTVVMTLLLGASVLLNWKEDGRKDHFRRFFVPLLAAVLSLPVAALAGVNDFPSFLLIFSAAFAGTASVMSGWRFVLKNPSVIGGSISHAGVALILIAIVASGRYDSKETIRLPRGESQNILGTQLRYIGYNETHDGKVLFGIEVARNQSKSLLMPVMYYSEFTNSVMRNPDYWVRLHEDIYIEPVSYEPSEEEIKADNLIELQKGSRYEYGKYMLRFLQFRLDEHKPEAMHSNSVTWIGAAIEIQRGSKKDTLVPITVFQGSRAIERKAAFLSNDTLGFVLYSMHIPMDNQPAHITIVPVNVSQANAMSATPDALVVELSIKPFMSFVWIGAALIIAGAIVAWKRRKTLADSNSGNEV